MIKSFEAPGMKLMRLDHHDAYQQYHLDRLEKNRPEDRCQLILTKRLNIDN